MINTSAEHHSSDNGGAALPRGVPRIRLFKFPTQPQNLRHTHRQSGMIRVLPALFKRLRITERFLNISSDSLFISRCSGSAHEGCVSAKDVINLVSVLIVRLLEPRLPFCRLTQSQIH